MTTIFYATDIHGSSICWKKFINAGKFYNADVLIMGGDLSGKAIVPIVDQGNGVFRCMFLEQEIITRDESQLLDIEKKICSRGYYPYRTTREEISTLEKAPENITQIFHQEANRRMAEWLSIAEDKLNGGAIRCYVSLGNDDIPELEDLIGSSSKVKLAEGKVIPLDGDHEMVSCGWSNPTPWHTYREEADDLLLARYRGMIADIKKPEQSIFNFHVPPYGTVLDQAPEMSHDFRPKYAGNSLESVGSKAVRQVLEETQPLLGLFGHIHESKGTARIGRTLCVNPGSMYEQGILCGVLVKLGSHKIESHLIVNG